MCVCDAGGTFGDEAKLMIVAMITGTVANSDINSYLDSQIDSTARVKVALCATVRRELSLPRVEILRVSRAADSALQRRVARVLSEAKWPLALVFHRQENAWPTSAHEGHRRPLSDHCDTYTVNTLGTKRFHFKFLTAISSLLLWCKSN